MSVLKQTDADYLRMEADHYNCTCSRKYLHKGLPDPSCTRCRLIEIAYKLDRLRAPAPEPSGEEVNEIGWIIRKWAEEDKIILGPVSESRLAHKLAALLSRPTPGEAVTCVERFADNGAHSHWDMIEKATGKVLASYPPDDQPGEAGLREAAINDFRMDELDAVMHSVDKWFDEGDPRLRNNPATRAADAREIALQAIERSALAQPAAPHGERSCESCDCGIGIPCGFIQHCKSGPHPQNDYYRPRQSDSKEGQG